MSFEYTWLHLFGTVVICNAIVRLVSLFTKKNGVPHFETCGLVSFHFKLPEGARVKIADAKPTEEKEEEKKE